MTFTMPDSPIALLFLNLVLGIILSLLVAWYYIRFGKSLSNRTQFAATLPILTLITLLVITVIKSSLALSLGLVGALSIVRFRTAIKDPEELVFLFLAIAIGLGLAADQRIPTLAGMAVIMLYLLIRAWSSRNNSSSHSIYLNIDVESDQAGAGTFEQVNQLLLSEVPSVDLRRMDSQGNRLQMTYYLFIRNQKTIMSVMDRLKNALPGSSISIVEQNNLLGE
jgi:hypothetical protein